MPFSTSLQRMNTLNTPGLSGTFEHKAQMADKAAFGKVHLNSIQTALHYHHILDHIKLQLKSLYTDFKTCITTNEFRTLFVSIGRGVLRGDCLSTLLFNLCFNSTFLRHLRSEKYRQFGFSLRFLNPISDQESENQPLINRFIIGYRWSGMTIRVDKWDHVYCR